MKKKKVWRYYCEFCKKANCSGASMSRHEKSCTANPNRYCGMCKNTIPVERFIKALGSGDEKGLDRLRDETEGCPACMLAAIRQSGLQYYDLDEDGPHGHYIEAFNYKKEKERWWADKNDEALAHEYNYYQY